MIIINKNENIHLIRDSKVYFSTKSNGNKCLIFINFHINFYYSRHLDFFRKYLVDSLSEKTFSLSTPIYGVHLAFLRKHLV